MSDLEEGLYKIKEGGYDYSVGDPVDHPDFIKQKYVEGSELDIDSPEELELYPPLERGWTQPQVPQEILPEDIG
jgi:hypothetical protein